MKVDQTMKLLAVLAVILICWVSTVEPQVPRIRTVTFKVGKPGYNKFIEDLRKKVLEGVKPNNESKIPDTMKVLANSNDFPFNDTRRYVVVKLVSPSSSFVEFGIDITDVYVLGYRPQRGNNAFFFMGIDNQSREILFKDSKNKTDLSYTGNYESMKKVTGNRDKIDLGFSKLEIMVENLNRNTTQEPVTAKSLLVCIQMVSEAARYKYIQNEFVKLRHNDTIKPNSTMMGFQNNWDQLSKAVQNAHDNGTFKGNVTIAPYITYSNVNSLIPIMSLLKWHNKTNFSATAPLSELNEEALD